MSCLLVKYYKQKWDLSPDTESVALRRVMDFFSYPIAKEIKTGHKEWKVYQTCLF